MIPPTLDFILRVGRLLGTVRSLIKQTEDLLTIIENNTLVDIDLVDGLDL